MRRPRPARPTRGSLDASPLPPHAQIESSTGQRPRLLPDHTTLRQLVPGTSRPHECRQLDRSSNSPYPAPQKRQAAIGQRYRDFPSVADPSANPRLPLRLLEDLEQQSARRCARWSRRPVFRGEQPSGRRDQVSLALGPQAQTLGRAPRSRQAYDRRTLQLGLLGDDRGGLRTRVGGSGEVHGRDGERV
jgi:hypothetical protein